ncbi:helix-turn-helix domain-containing protein [Saccharopolyspora sp. HNM0983]|uniref:Helix-turn-helix domain-containing protein n=1 Tax=Saccharopolyspora montiporae TaxID=2781240 RepID=A0A929B702_9PSEU|nr:helix-turn-helix transcriptional regulator [Saccharopolyspora sp. HNM0983]MBE9372985.1 helix-turn-helix domain-containing protein [Saccharopolyspora sp. HNM0983]
MTATPRRRALARELREARRSSGLSMRQVGDRLGWSESKVSRFERGVFGSEPDYDDVLRFLTAIGQPQSRQEPILRLVREINEPVWWEFGLELSTQTTALLDAEQRAHRILQTSVTVVPGLLQTRNYSRALLRETLLDTGNIDEYVEMRQVRKRVFGYRKLDEYAVVLDESTLRPIGTADTMVEQLEHLRELAEEPKISITVVRNDLDTGSYPGLAGGFELIDFGHDRAVVHVEHRSCGVFVDDPDDVRPFREVADRVRKVALSERESAELIAEYAQQYRRRKG